jgi:exodeoxyribonuclease VIII
MRITFDDYCAIEAVNWSSLKDMAVSPRMFRHRTKHPRRDTEALAFGRLFHTALLEPERFAATYVVEPDFGDCRFKENKARRDGWRADHAHRELMSEHDAYTVRAMVAAVREHRVASGLLSEGTAEETITWTDPRTGLACKGRIDWLRRRFVTDIKTTRRETMGAFKRDIRELLYYSQVGWYTDGAVAAGRLEDPEPPLILGVQDVEPWDVMVVRVGGEDLDAGRAVWRMLLDRFAACVASDWWPGVAPEIVDLRLPNFAPGMNFAPVNPEDF